MSIDLTDPIFHDETSAREYFEAQRWPNGPYCPHCGEIENVHRMAGESHQDGMCYCRSCGKKFTVTVGSVMESTHLPLTKWALAFRMMAASKKGVSAHQLHRTLGITYKSAWFLAHRIREAMTDTDPSPLGGEGKIVEADEAYHGKVETPVPTASRQGRPYLKRDITKQKRPIFALVERGGAARAYHMPMVTGKNVRDVLVRKANTASRLHTDESRLYIAVGAEFTQHESVNHSAKEYARGKGDDLVTTNSVEGFFGIFKRGMVGVYQHCSEQHLQRYLDEFSFRYSNRIKLGIDDDRRTELAVIGATGKRLTYRRIGTA